MTKIDTILSSAVANLRKNAETQQRIEKKIDQAAALMTAQRTALEDICNSFETEGCEGCGTVDIKVINKARKLLGWNKLDGELKD
jgi:hypothetical protein